MSVTAPASGRSAAGSPGCGGLLAAGASRSPRYGWREAACRIRRHPALALAAQEGRHLALDGGGAEHFGLAHADEAGAFGMAGEAGFEADGAQRAGVAAGGRRGLSLGCVCGSRGSTTRRRRLPTMDGRRLHAPGRPAPGRGSRQPGRAGILACPGDSSRAGSALMSRSEVLWLRDPAARPCFRRPAHPRMRLCGERRCRRHGFPPRTVRRGRGPTAGAHFRLTGCDTTS